MLYLQCMYNEDTLNVHYLGQNMKKGKDFIQKFALKLCKPKSVFLTLKSFKKSEQMLKVVPR